MEKHSLGIQMSIQVVAAVAAVLEKKMAEHELIKLDAVNTVQIRVLLRISAVVVKLADER